jgi:hypothetical protein
MTPTLGTLRGTVSSQKKSKRLPSIILFVLTVCDIRETRWAIFGQRLGSSTSG